MKQSIDIDFDHRISQNLDIVGQKNRETGKTRITQISYYESGKFSNDIFLASRQLTLEVNSKQADIDVMYFFILSSPHILKIQSYFRMKQQKQKYAIIKKQAKKRRFVIQELLKTEENYVKNLEFINNNLLDVTQSQKLLSEADFKIYFQNWKPIYQLNVQFLSEIKSQFVKYHHNITFGHILKKYVLFFKIYFEYCQGYKSEQLKQIREGNKKFDALVTKLEESNNISLIDSVLIEPIQRLPRYQLLLKEFLQFTWKDHPDYLNLQDSLSKFKQVNLQIDQYITKILQNQMLFDLQKKFFDLLNVKIVQPTRRFLSTDAISILTKEKEKQVLLYLCNDMVIITQRIEGVLSERLINYFYLTPKLLLFNPDAPSLLFRITETNESVTFIASDSEQKQKIVSEFEQIIRELHYTDQVISVVKPKIDRQIAVSIYKTENRFKIYKKYTSYHLIIKNKDEQYKCQTRQKVLRQIEDLIKERYKNTPLNFVNDQRWIADNLNKQPKSKRNVIIEEFLGRILNSEQVINDYDQKVIELLGLPLNFYDKARENSICEVVLQRKNTVKSSNSDLSRSQSQSKKTFKIEEKTIDVKIRLMDGKKVYLQAPNTQLVRNLLQDFSEHIGLLSDDDFQLYLVCEKQQLLLENIDLREVQEYEIKCKHSLRQKLFGHSHKTLKLLLRKQIFLNPEIEKKEYQKNYIRLHLICHQIFSDIKSSNFETAKQYCQIATYYLLIKYSDFFLNSQQIYKGDLTFAKIKEIIPDKSLGKMKESLWIQQVLFELQQIRGEIQRLVQINYQNATENSSAKHIYIAMLLFLKLQSSNPLFGASLFQIKVSKKTRDLFKNLLKALPDQSQFIAIKNDRLLILSKTEILSEIMLSKITASEFNKQNFFFSISENQELIKITIQKIQEFQYLFDVYREISYSQ